MECYNAVLNIKFEQLKLPLNALGSSFFSHDRGKKVDSTLFDQKPFSRANLIEKNKEEDFDMKKQQRIEKLPCPVENSDAFGKLHVDSGLNRPS